MKKWFSRKNLSGLLAVLSFGGFLFSMGGCGVKGDPVPPATPAEIGRGKPLFKTESDTTPPAQPRKYYRDNEPKEDDQNEPDTR